MDITAFDLAEVIDDPHERREILRTLNEAYETGMMEDGDKDLLLEHAAALLTLDNNEIDAILLLMGAPKALAKAFSNG